MLFMSICRCTIRYKYACFTSNVNSFEIIENKDNTLLLHSLSDVDVKSIKYNTKKESGVAFTKSYSKTSIDILGYRTWSSPYELTVRVTDTENIPRYKRGSTKFIDTYGSIDTRHETTADSVTLVMDDDNYIKITGLENERNVQVDCSSDINFHITRNDNCLDLSGAIINFYLERQLEKFGIDGQDYTDNINSTLKERECVN